MNFLNLWALRAFPTARISHSQARKRHINMNFLFCPVGLGTTPGFLLILHSESPANPGLSLGQTQFVPGTIPRTKGGTESLCEKSLCAFFARYILA